MMTNFLDRIMKEIFRFGKLLALPKFSTTLILGVYQLGSENFLKLTTA